VIILAYEEDNFTINWSDTEFKKYVHTVRIVWEGWFYNVHESGWKERDNYCIHSATKNVASTNGVTGHCTCEAFKTKEPTPIGKIPCKHLIVCNERRLSWLESYKEQKKEGTAKDRKRKDELICEHLKKTKGDPNSLLNDEKFVKKMIKGEKITQ